MKFIALSASIYLLRPHTPWLSHFLSLFPMHKHYSGEVYYMVDFVPPPSWINEICRHPCVSPLGALIFLLSEIESAALCASTVWVGGNLVSEQGTAQEEYHTLKIRLRVKKEWHLPETVSNHGAFCINATLNTWHFMDGALLHFNVPCPRNLKKFKHEAVCV